MRTRDSEGETWQTPFIDQEEMLIVNYTAKHLPDIVEALIAAYLLSSSLRYALRFITRINLVNLNLSRLINKIPEKDVLFDVRNIAEYDFDIEDDIVTVFHKYYRIHGRSNHGEKLARILFNDEASMRVVMPGSAFERSPENLEPKPLIEVLEYVQTEILNYRFNDISVLVEALTHSSYGGEGERNYEKLEVLGDALLDCIINTNLIKQAIRDSYDAYDVHQAKMLLVNNQLLAKLVCLYGLQAFLRIDFGDDQGSTAARGEEDPKERAPLGN